MTGKLKHCTLFLAVFVAACVTVNIYFPAAAIQKAADEIVSDVRGSEGKQDQKTPKSGDQSRLMEILQCLNVGVREANAQINIDVTTPAIRNLRQALKDNFSALKPFYEKGALGENNNGLVEIKDQGTLNLKEKADLKRVSDQENKNRMALYNEIVKANKLAGDSLPKLQKIFAKSWRDAAQPGWWVQNDNGQWEKKK